MARRYNLYLYRIALLLALYCLGYAFLSGAGGLCGLLVLFLVIVIAVRASVVVILVLPGTIALCTACAVFFIVFLHCVSP